MTQKHFELIANTAPNALSSPSRLDVVPVGLPVNFYTRLRDGTQPKSACRFPSSRLSIREHDRNLLISHLQLLACGSLRLKLSQLRHRSGCGVFPIARFVAAFPFGCCVALCHVPSKVLRDGSPS
jgi:hypothetical protein